MFLSEPLRVALVGSLFTGLLSCGGKAGGSGRREPDAAGPGGAVLRKDGGALTLSVPHRVSAPLKGHDAFEARYAFRSEAAYELKLEKPSHDFVGCDGPRPVPRFVWKDAKGSNPLPVKEGVAFGAEAGNAYALSIEIDGVATCREVLVTFMVTGTKRGSSPSLPAAPSPSAASADVDFELDAILREFAAPDSDKGALFIMKPSVDRPVTIKEVKGPRFIGGVRKVIISETSMTKVFANTAKPLPDERRRAILEKYRGATAIYFEGYPGRLCSGSEWSVQVESTFDGWELLTDFTFAATPSETDDCRFQFASMTTRSIGVTSR